MSDLTLADSMLESLRYVLREPDQSPFQWQPTVWQMDIRTERGFYAASVSEVTGSDLPWRAFCAGPGGDRFHGDYATATEAKAAIEQHITGASA